MIAFTYCMCYCIYMVDVKNKIVFQYCFALKGVIIVYLFVSANSSAAKRIASMLDISLAAINIMLSLDIDRIPHFAPRDLLPALMNYTMNSHLNTEKSF